MLQQHKYGMELHRHDGPKERLMDQWKAEWMLEVERDIPGPKGGAGNWAWRKVREHTEGGQASRTRPTDPPGAERDMASPHGRPVFGDNLKEPKGVTVRQGIVRRHGCANHTTRQSLRQDTSQCLFQSRNTLSFAP